MIEVNKIFAGDCREVLKTFPDNSVHCIVTSSQRLPNGRFAKGNNYSPATQFKKGEHWRKEKPFWNKEWLYNEYILKGRSAKEIATDFNLTEASITFWLRKHSIKIRNVSEARQRKYWGLTGGQNGMFGKTNNLNPNWKGGISPERSAFYSSQEWKNVSQEVYRKYKGICQRCAIRKRSLHIHHLVSFSVKELRADINNLTLLCKDCHDYVHSKQNIKKDFIITI